jgi:hypothetical protein
MATWRYSMNPEDSLQAVVGAAGAAVVTKNIELTINQAPLITDALSPTNPRGIKKSEILIALKTMEEFIIQDTSGGFL